MYIYFKTISKFGLPIYLDFLFPQSTRTEYLKICESRDIKFFCRDFVEKSEFMFVMGTVGVILILISLVRIMYI